MKSTKPFAKKERQLKFLTKKIKRLLTSGQFYQMSTDAQKKLIAKLQFLHHNLKWVLPTKRLQKIVAGASIFLSISLSNLNAQGFLAPVENPFGLEAGEHYKIPTLVDIDGDGDMDLFTNTYNGYGEEFQLDFYENTGTVQDPSFASTPLVNPFGFVIDSVFNQSIWNFDLADMDNDGDQDLLLVGGYHYAGTGTDSEGAFNYYENVGTAQSPMFAAPVMDPFGIGRLVILGLGKIADIDNDGDLDIYATELYGKGRFFENTGTASAPAFAEGVDEPFGLGTGNAIPATTFVHLNYFDFGDIDGDGDIDLMGSVFDYSYDNGIYSFPFYYQENSGGTAPTFAAPDLDNNPIGFDDMNNSLGGIVSIADMDGDGDMDVLMNETVYGSDEYFDHRWLYFENNSLGAGIDDLLNDANVQFFPNPTSDQISIKSDSELEITDLRVFDVTGRMVEQIQFNGSSVDVAHLSSGVYLMKVYSGDEFVGGNKLIKK